jgi:hypothetical protein
VYFQFGSIPNAYSTTLSHEESQLYKQMFVRRGEAGRGGGNGASALNGKMNFRDKETDLFALNKL